MKQTHDKPRPPAKRPYRAPKLVVHGDLRTMTQTKAGNSNDGGSKPNTRVLGSGGAG
jgi:hypothetical protein